MAVGAYNWTGFYIGGHGGIGWGRTPDQSMTNASVLVDINPTTFVGSSKSFGVGGFQAGYNWQFNPAWVIGLEGDFSWGKFGSTNSLGPPIMTGAVLNPCCSLAMSNNSRWLASVRGRVGYAFDRSLIYLTGGAAWMRVDYSGTNNYIGASVTTNFSSTRSGWTIGGGIDYALMANLLLRAEYLYYGFGSGPTSSVPGILGGPITYTWGSSNVSVLRAGLSVKF